ncbi:MAG: CAP domain-containing protein, partial [Planctomycetota bacterium]
TQGSKKLKELKEKYRKKWEEARKEALRVIFDKKIYPDENHGRVGQPIVDEKVKALRRVYEFFNLLLKRDIQKVLKLSPKQAQTILARIQEYEGRFKHYSSVLRKNGKDPLPAPRPLSPRAKSLISYRAGKLAQAHKYAKALGPWGQQMFRRMIAQKIMDYNKKLAQQKNSPVTAVEAEQIRITNQYRISMGRTPLEIDPKLVRCARKHSVEMVKLGYFSHTSPVAKNKTPSMRAQNEGHDGNVGENIYMNGAGATAFGAFDAWYHSSGHHRNMLNDKWTCIGVGHHMTHMTQNFGTCTNCHR